MRAVYIISALGMGLHITLKNSLNENDFQNSLYIFII